MKILFDTQIYELQVFGGISLYFTKLLEQFSKDNEIGFELPVIYSDNYYLKQSELRPKFKLPEENFLLKKQVLKFLSMVNKQNFLNKLQSGNFDLVHLTFFDKKFLNYIKEKPYVITVHDMTNEILPEQFVFDKQAKSMTEIKKLLIENAAEIITISENTKKDILQFCDIPEEKINVVYHGLPFNEVDNDFFKEDLPERYILYVGQRAKYKNFYNFLNSIEELLKSDETLYLIMAGGGDLNRSEKNFIKNMEIKNKIIKKPIHCDEQLMNYYKNALCFVFPSLYEGFGFPILEAFQCGCPVICSDNSSFPEVAKQAAVYFDPYNSESIKESIKKVIYNAKLRQQLIHAGKERLKDFSWTKTAEKTKDVYKKALYG